MEDQLSIIESRIRYYNDSLEILEKECVALNELIVAIEGISTPEELNVLRLKYEGMQLRKKEIELQNEIAAKTAMMEEYISRQNETEGFKEFIQSMWEHKDGLLQDARSLMEMNVEPYFKDRLKALVMQIEHDDFKKRLQEHQDRTLLLLYQMLGQGKQLLQQSKRKIIT